MAWVIPLLVLAVMGLIGLLTMFLIDAVVGPIYNQVMGNGAVQSIGFDQGLEVSLRIGGMIVIPALLLGLTLWFFVLRLRRDKYQGVR